MDGNQPQKRHLLPPVTILVLFVLFVSFPTILQLFVFSWVFPEGSGREHKDPGQRNPISRLIERYLNDADSAAGTLLKGDTAPDIVLENLAGGSVSLSQLAQKHRLVVLNFFATWCDPCRAELPELSQLAMDFGKKGVLVLAVSAERAQKISEFAGNRYPGILFARDGGGTVRSAFGVSGIPATFVLSPRLKVLARHSGYSATRMRELRRTVQLLLESHEKEPLPDSPGDKGRERSRSRI